MKVARWSYVKEPVFPPEDVAGKPFHHPQMYASMVQVVRDTRLTGA